MAQTTTLQLLPQTSFNNTRVIGEKQPAASYYAGNKNLQTITWNFTTVKATVYIEASLVAEPTSDSDWFVVHIIATGNNTLTQSSFVNLSGNFVWLRVRVDPFTMGVIQNIKVSY